MTVRSEFEIMSYIEVYTHTNVLFLKEVSL
jgi:hypothetical protein